MIRPFYVLMVLLCALSCTMHEVEPVDSGSDDADVVAVAFRTGVSCPLKSSVSVDEPAINNINVYAYRNGVLVDEVFSVDLDEIVLRLPADYTYNIYAIANVGPCRADVDEETFLEELSCRIAGIGGLARGLPMRCANRNVYVTGKSQTVDILLERMAAKVTFSVDKASLLEGLRVTSVRLCQSACIVHPFKWEGGSRVESPDDTFDGDHATAADLRSLNSGGEVFFYTLENCQGMLLPDNQDPSLKVPKMIPGKEGLCSYLEVGCEFDGSGLLEGDVCYRLYLGLDDCSSFDVPGNSCINVSLMLTGDGLKKVTWKVNADVSIRDGYASGEVGHGRHGMSDLYVGEVLLYEVELAEELAEYLGNDVSGCSLRLVRDGEIVPGLSARFLDGQGLCAELRCEEVAEGALCLFDSAGRFAGCLEDEVRISLPRVVLSEYSEWMDDAPVEQLTYIPECEVNGAAAGVYIYLTDRQGYNLNGIHSYGFDSGLFDFRDGGTRSGDDAVRAVMADFEQMPQTAGSPAVRVDVSCANDGRSHEENLLLTEVYAAERSAMLTVEERNFELSSWFRIGLGIPQITLTLVDNGWAGYYACQLAMKVDNPSNLPLDVSFWQIVATNSAYGAVDYEYVEDNLRVEHLEYMTGEFYNGAPQLYGSMSGFCSERNEEGDQALDDGSALVYPLEGISTDDIIKAANYDRRGTGQMIHLVDATLAGRYLSALDLRLEDMVSNGSSRYDYMYYSEDSWNYRGAGLCSADLVLEWPQAWTHDCPNLTPGRMDRLVDRWDQGSSVCVSMLYDASQGRASVMTHAGKGAQYGLTLSFQYAGKVDGYVQTYPNGTWGKPQDNRCSVAFSHVKTGVPLVESALHVWADDAGLKSAMDQIYGYTYKDSDRPLGADAYMHRAHPTAMALNMNLCVEGEKGGELYPYYVLWDADYLEYYHSQDAKIYKCALNSVTNAYRLSVVRSK